MDSPLDEQYLTWLYARTGSIRETRHTKTFWSLFKFLYCKEFTWFIPNDDNRVGDGRYMRHEFLDDAGLSGSVDPNWLGMDCSVLEMLLSLAERITFEADRTTHYWFWILINNLGLHQYNDRSFNEDVVNDIVDNLIWRTYEPDGNGGLFPLRNPSQDQRDVEIWYQLAAYLIENE